METMAEEKHCRDGGRGYISVHNQTLTDLNFWRHGASSARFLFSCTHLCDSVLTNYCSQRQLQFLRFAFTNTLPGSLTGPHLLLSTLSWERLCLMKASTLGNTKAARSSLFPTDPTRPKP